MSWLTITEAAAAAGVSQKTIRRRLKAGEFAEARQDGEGHSAPWLIPAEALGIKTREITDGEAAELRELLRLSELGKVESESRLREEITARERLEREYQRARSDLEEERTTRERAEREAIEHRARADERDRRITELTADRERERALAEVARAERAELEERLREELAEVRSALGWWAHRRLERAKRNR